MEKMNDLEIRTKLFVADLLEGVDEEDSIQSIIKYIIEKVGIFTHSDRVCIYEEGTDENVVSKLYQWKANAPVAEDECSQPIHERGLNTWIERLKLRKMVLVENRESLRKLYPLEYERMEQQGIESFVIIPLYTKGRLPACMSLINPDFSTFALLESSWLYLGKEIGLFYHRERINREHYLFMQGIRSSNLSEFIVDYKTKRYRAFRITSVLSNVIPEEGEWDWIRNLYASLIKAEHRDEFMRKTDSAYLEVMLHTKKSTFAIDLEREVNGNNTWFRLEFSVVSLDENGKLESFVVLVKDITQMKKEEEEKQQVIKALSSFYAVSFMIDIRNHKVQAIKQDEAINKEFPEGNLPFDTFWNTFCNRMVDPEYVSGLHDFMNLDTIEERMKLTKVLSFEYQGAKIGWGRIILAPAKWDQNSCLEKVVFAVQDITEQKHKEEWMQYKLEHDELTGTLNRGAFNRVTKMLDETLTPYALVLLDIDKFKAINDTFGHDVGDKVLSYLVTVLNKNTRNSDKIFRMGGDEFAIVMNRMMIGQAKDIVRVIDRVNEITMSPESGLPPFSISAGATFSVLGYDETIYHNADKALYQTKETTHMGCTVFEEMR